MAGACYLLIDNRAVLSGAGDALFIKAVPWVVLAIFGAGMVLALVLRFKAKDRYAAVGRFTREDMA
jgi:hypothetical protein